MLRSASDESQWVDVEDDCITSELVRVNPEDDFCVGRNREVNLKCGGPASKAVDGSCNLFEGEGSDADQACAVEQTGVRVQRTPSTAAAAFCRRSHRLQVKY